MRNGFISAAAIMAVMVMLMAGTIAHAGEVELFEDVETGQIYTKPGPNRILLSTEQAEAVEKVMHALYQDTDTGAVYAKPGEGRIPVASSARTEVAAAPAVDEDAIAERAARKVEEKMASNSPVDIPAWVKKISIDGDLRLRYDLQDTDLKVANHRGRYRFRLNLKAPVNDMFKVAFQFGTGADHNSGNQTFGPSFDAPALHIRAAYAEFIPADWLLVRGGMMKNVLWLPTDGIWDHDINPTGIGTELVYKNETFAEPFMNAAFYTIEQHSGSNKDPFMYVLQPGVKLKLTDDVGLKVAGTYNGFGSVKGSDLTNSAGSNTTSGGLHVYDYDGFVASAELGIKKPLLFVEQVKFFGEYAYNPDPEVLNDGYIVGLNFGSEKLKDFGDWQFAYNWRRMGRDAILDILPDSDALSGKTNITGHEFIFKLGLAKHVEFGLDFYKLRDITTNIDENRLQADFIFAFGK